MTDVTASTDAASTRSAIRSSILLRCSRKSSGSVESFDRYQRTLAGVGAAQPASRIATIVARTHP